MLGSRHAVHKNISKARGATRAEHKQVRVLDSGEHAIITGSSLSSDVGPIVRQQATRFELEVAFSCEVAAHP